MNTFKFALLSTAAVVSATACGGGVSHDVAPTGQSVAPPAASTEMPSSCSSATADILKSAIQRERKHAFSGPFTVYDVRCSGDWAFAHIDHESFDPNTNPPSLVLFHDDGGGWRLANYGSGFKCTNDGVPPSIATDLGCS